MTLDRIRMRSCPAEDVLAVDEPLHDNTGLYQEPLIEIRGLY